MPNRSSQARNRPKDPSNPQVLRGIDWLSGPDHVVLDLLAPLRWDLKRDDRVMREALKSAIEGHRPTVVAALIDAGVPVNLPLLDAHREVSALRTALGHRNPEVVKALLERGACLSPAESAAKPAALWLLAGPIKARRKTGSPERKRAREAQILDLLVAHRLAQRPDPVLQQRLITAHGGNSVQVLDAALDHGLIDMSPGGDPILLGATLHHGQLALALRLIERGGRPDRHRPQALDDLVLQAAQHTPRERDTLERWQHRALTLIEPLATPGAEHDLQAALTRLLTRLDEASTETRSAPAPLPALPHRLLDKPPVQPVLRLAAAGVWPQRWWAALRAVDAPTLNRWMAVEQGACARWIDDHNRNALHVLMQALYPIGASMGPLDWDEPPGGVGDLHLAALSETQKAAVPEVVRQLLHHGVHPLWGSGGMGAPGTHQPTGALWVALDMPGPMGEILSGVMLDALTPDEREPLIVRAVQDRRSRLTLDRLIAHGVPLDSLWDGDGALHKTVKVPACHDRLPVLLAYGARADQRNAHGDTPRDLAEAMQLRAQSSAAKVNELQALIHQLDVALLEQAVQDVLPAQGSLRGPRRPRL